MPFIAWKGTDKRLNLESSSNGVNFGNKVTYAARTPTLKLVRSWPSSAIADRDDLDGDDGDHHLESIVVVSARSTPRADLHLPGRGEHHSRSGRDRDLHAGSETSVSSWNSAARVGAGPLSIGASACRRDGSGGCIRIPADLRARNRPGSKGLPWSSPLASTAATVGWPSGRGGTPESCRFPVRFEGQGTLPTLKAAVILG